MWNDSNKGRGEGEGAGTQKGDGIIEVRKVFILSFVVIITLPYKERKCRQQGGLETGVVGGVVMLPVQGVGWLPVQVSFVSQLFPLVVLAPEGGHHKYQYQYQS